MNTISRASCVFNDEKKPIKEARRAPVTCQYKNRAGETITETALGWVTDLTPEEVARKYGAIILTVSGQPGVSWEILVYDGYVE